MIRYETRVIITCDFCGKEFLAGESYPRNNNGYAEFRLSLIGFLKMDRISDLDVTVGEDSDCLGLAKGHMCPDCLDTIGKMIKYNKTHIGDNDG